jgi:hypothetical protein
MNDKEESCDPVDFIDPKEATLQELYYLAERGVAEAKEMVKQYDKEVDAELQRAEKQIDTVSAKALTVEWIED